MNEKEIRVTEVDVETDAEKGAKIGGIGGAVTGAVAGSMVGPAGAVLGAVVGGVAGAVASGAAVNEIDKRDSDATTTGLPLHDKHEEDVRIAHDRDVTVRYDRDGNVVNDLPGIQTGGHAVDGTPDTRGITEKIADKITGDRIDDKTGKPVV